MVVIRMPSMTTQMPETADLLLRVSAKATNTIIMITTLLS